MYLCAFNTSCAKASNFFSAVASYGGYFSILFCIFTTLSFNTVYKTLKFSISFNVMLSASISWNLYIYSIYYTVFSNYKLVILSSLANFYMASTNYALLE